MRRMNLENEYNNRQRVPHHGEIMGRWKAASETFCESLGDRAELGISYGEGERQAYDVFWPESDRDAAPLVVYIHGGYWQRGDRSDYSVVAEGFVAAGCVVAVPSYSLCPDAKVMDIIGELTAFITELYKKMKRRPVVVGHSAGGHLASALLATDWSGHGDVPADVVRQAYAISGVFNLRPLIRTSINDALGLERDAADDASPALWSVPAGRRLVAAVGALESREFIRQSIEIAARWGEVGVRTDCVIVPDTNHFTVIHQLREPGSGMFERILEMARLSDADFEKRFAELPEKKPVEPATAEAAPEDVAEEAADSPETSETAAGAASAVADAAVDDPPAAEETTESVDASETETAPETTEG
ncbi:MAG: alpha/beta hydrolase [Pseudomonadota bacterium]